MMGNSESDTKSSPEVFPEIYERNKSEPTKKEAPLTVEQVKVEPKKEEPKKEEDKETVMEDELDSFLQEVLQGKHQTISLPSIIKKYNDEKGKKRIFDFLESHKNNSSALSCLAQLHNEYNDRTKSFKYQEEALKLDNKNMQAMYDIAYNYNYGVGCSVDTQKAIECYEECARHGYWCNCSTYCLGGIYKSRKDYANSIKWYELSCNTFGNEYSREELAQIYENEGAFKDEKKAIEEYEKLFKGNNEYTKMKSALRLAELYKAIDINKMLEWYEKYVDKTDDNKEKIRVMNELGKEYLIKEDEKKGNMWYEKSANLGDTEAMFQLACQLLDMSDDENVDVNLLNKAKHWFEKASELNHLEATLQLAKLVMPEEMETLYERAITLGHKKSMLTLAVGFETGTNLEGGKNHFKRDINKAIKWYETIVTQEEKEKEEKKDKKEDNDVEEKISAVERLGDIYKNMGDEEKDEKVKCEWYKKGNDIGHPDCVTLLAEYFYKDLKSNNGKCSNGGCGTIDDVIQMLKIADTNKAKILLGEIYGDKDNKCYDDAEELSWYQRAYETDDYYAGLKVAEIYFQKDDYEGSFKQWLEVITEMATKDYNEEKIFGVEVVELGKKLNIKYQEIMKVAKINKDNFPVLTNKLLILNEKIKESNTKLFNFEKENEELKTTLFNVEKEREELKSSLSNVEKENESLKTSLRYAGKDCDELMGKLLIGQKKHQTDAEKIREQDIRLEKLSEEFDHLDYEHRTLDYENKTLEQNKEETEKFLNEACRKLKSDNDKLSFRIKEIENVYNVVATLEQEKKTLTSKVQELENILAKQDNKLVETTCEKQQWEEAYNTSWKYWSEEFDKVQKQLDTYTDENVKLQEDNQKLNDEQNNERSIWVQERSTIVETNKQLVNDILKLKENLLLEKEKVQKAEEDKKKTDDFNETLKHSLTILTNQVKTMESTQLQTEKQLEFEKANFERIGHLCSVREAQKEDLEKQLQARTIQWDQLNEELSKNQVIMNGLKEKLKRVTNDKDAFYDQSKQDWEKTILEHDGIIQKLNFVIQKLNGALEDKQKQWEQERETALKMTEMYNKRTQQWNTVYEESDKLRHTLNEKEFQLENMTTQIKIKTDGINKQHALLEEVTNHFLRSNEDLNMSNLKKRELEIHVKDLKEQQRIQDGKMSVANALICQLEHDIKQMKTEKDALRIQLDTDFKDMMTEKNRLNVQVEGLTKTLELEKSINDRLTKENEALRDENIVHINS
jgi:TPR repeat protein